ncbi:hypothetical protein JHK84_042844 [Glycine max]|nr:hypothetical protein JHK84_042844 [Glycine max]
MNVTLVDSALFAFLFPSLWEIEVAVAAFVFVILAYRFFAAQTGYAEGEQQENQEGTETPPSNDELGGIAKAFNISSRTASAISICMALAVLTFSLFMTSLGQGMVLKTKVLSYATLLFGFMTAAVLEFSGALMMGTNVTSTMQKGILVANVFNGKDSLLFAGLLSSIAAAGTCYRLQGVGLRWRAL